MYEKLLETRMEQMLRARSHTAQSKGLRQWPHMGLQVGVGGKVHLHTSAGALPVCLPLNLEWDRAFLGQRGCRIHSAQGWEQSKE